jgi:hypothetical protein
LLVLLVVRDGDQAIALAFDDGVGAVEGGLFGGVLLHVLFDGVAGEVVGVLFVARGHRLVADEGAIFVEEVPAAAHDGEQALDGRVRVVR